MAAIQTSEKARSPWVKAILETLERASGRGRGSWVSVEDLREAAYPTIPADQAITVYNLRVDKGESRKVQIARGKKLQVMLACITLYQTGNIEQRGRGDNKEYRLLKGERQPVVVSNGKAAKGVKSKTKTARRKSA